MSPYNPVTAVLRQLAGLELCPKIHARPHQIYRSPSCLKRPMTWCDGHYLHRALPFLSGHRPAAAHVFHRLPEASIHLLTAVNTKRGSSKPRNLDPENRRPGQLAGAAAREDRRTHNQTDRRQHHQTTSITSSLRRGEACSTRDVILPLGTGSRLRRILSPSNRQA